LNNSKQLFHSVEIQILNSGINHKRIENTNKRISDFEKTHKNGFSTFKMPISE